MAPVLATRRRRGFARKIRVMLIEKNISHEVEMVNLWEPNELQQTNPIGKVPALKE